MAVVRKTVPPKPAGPTKARKVAPSVTAFALVTELSTPCDNLEDYSILLFGEKKIGKTTLAAMFPKAYFLGTEPGTKALAVYKTDIHDWRTFRTAVKALRKDRIYKTAVVDTIDLAFKMCEKYVCSELGVEHVSEADWGKGWSGLREEFESVMRDLIAAQGKGIIMISHSTEKEIKRRDGSKYDRIQPTMANIAREIVEPMVDIWAYYAYDGDQRTLTIRGDDHITAGHRLETRFQYEGRQVVTIDMGASKQEAYRNFLAAFNNTYVVASPPPVEDAPVRRVVKKVKKVK